MHRGVSFVIMFCTQVHVGQPARHHVPRPRPCIDQLRCAPQPPNARYQDLFTDRKHRQFRGITRGPTPRTPLQDTFCQPFGRNSLHRVFIRCQNGKHHARLAPHHELVRSSNQPLTVCRIQHCTAGTLPCHSSTGRHFLPTMLRTVRTTLRL